MGLNKIFSVPASVWEWILNLITKNRIARLEMKIESLETDNRRIKEHYSEASEILEQRRKLMEEKEEAMIRKYIEREQEIKELKQSVKEQTEEVLDRIAAAITSYFAEVVYFGKIREQNLSKIKELEKKKDFEAVSWITFYENKIDTARLDLSERALSTIFKIASIIAKKKQ